MIGAHIFGNNLRVPHLIQMLAATLLLQRAHSSSSGTGYIGRTTRAQPQSSRDQSNYSCTGYHEAEILAKIGAVARALCLHQISLEECSKVNNLGA
jgi:hypothetical protein